MDEIFEHTGIYDNINGCIYGSVEGKIHSIAKQFNTCAYMFADYAQANVMLDQIEQPTILYLLPPSGNLYVDGLRQMITDRPQTQIWFVCPSTFDFNGEANECRVEAMKRIAIRFIDAINKSGLFEQLDGNIEYQVAYDAFDENLTGICLNLYLKELEGIMLCDNDYKR